MKMKIDAPTKMRDGTTAEDPRLGRLVQFDDRSRAYSVSEVLPDRGLRTRSWRCDVHLDQGQTSACTGFSRTYDISGQPVAVKIRGALPKEPFAHSLYRLAQYLDEWPGQNYEGSSVLGALKAAQQLGFIGEYRWAFDMDDMLAALSHVGPVVVGTTWFNSMFQPRPSGLLEIRPSSGEAGGHAYTLRRILVTRSAKRAFLGAGEDIRSEPLLVVRNSWVKDWGKGGEAGIWPSDYYQHLWTNGEQSVVTTALHLA